MRFRVTSFKYKTNEIDQIRALFDEHPQLTLEHMRELLSFIQPQSNGLYGGAVKAEKKGFDCLYWALRIRTLKAFLRYLPQLVKEFDVHHESMCGWIEDSNHSKEGMPRFGYSRMPEPYLGLAFKGDSVHPVTYAENDDGSLRLGVLCGTRWHAHH